MITTSWKTPHLAKECNEYCFLCKKITPSVAPCEESSEPFDCRQMASPHHVDWNFCNDCSGYCDVCKRFLCDSCLQLHLNCGADDDTASAYEWSEFDDATRDSFVSIMSSSQPIPSDSSPAHERIAVSQKRIFTHIEKDKNDATEMQDPKRERMDKNENLKTRPSSDSEKPHHTPTQLVNISTSTETTDRSEDKPPKMQEPTTPDIKEMYRTAFLSSRKFSAAVALVNDEMLKFLREYAKSLGHVRDAPHIAHGAVVEVPWNEVCEERLRQADRRIQAAKLLFGEMPEADGMHIEPRPNPMTERCT